MLGVIAAILLPLLAVGLFIAVQKAKINNQTVSNLVNVAGIVSLFAAIVTLVLPVINEPSEPPTITPSIIPPTNTNTPVSLPSAGSNPIGGTIATTETIALTVGGFSNTKLEDWLWINQNTENASVTREFIDNGETFRWNITAVNTNGGDTYFTLLQRPANAFVSNFDLEILIDTSCKKINTGISFRSNGTEYYQFIINPEEKNFRFSSYSITNGWQDIDSGVISDIIKDNNNVVRVIADGNSFEIYINGQQTKAEGYIWKDEPASGRVGLVVNPIEPGLCTVDFKELTLTMREITPIK